MERIAIIGSCGAGKSTLAKSLGQKLALPIIHLDSYYWRANWVETPKNDWDTLHQKLLQGECWIIDGNYGSTMDIRLEAADTIIWLDFPRNLCLWRIIKRYLQYRGNVRDDMAAGCRERLTWEFLLYVYNFPRQQRPQIISRLNQHQYSKKIVILKNPNQVKTFLEEIIAIA
ncbi:MAG: DNA topology modulation protein [Xenococcaceae cyanobacterium MO_188.B32]|nr:DNA topology modulation protein [Xenococcaceae cyanobacterium MO_188.B32]